MATLRSIALNYIDRKGPRPPKALVRSINQLKKRDDIVISKPDKGSGVVVMNKSDYIRLLSEASINDETKFQPVSLQRPRTKGRPPKHYHPLLEKEKHLDSVVRRILPKHIADTVCLKGSRLAHLYGLPKTHKERLTMRPILSATGTYNYTLAKWLDEKLKPLSVNNHTISDVFQFAEEIRELDFNEDDILVSYDVSALFTNVPLEETIQILVNKAFNQNWLNETYNLNITQEDLVELLRVATKHQLFQFNGSLYEQIDGVAMGSPLGPLMANTFMCLMEEKLESEDKLPSFYKRYVDDTLAAVKDISTATTFLATLNEAHPAISFTMEVANNNKLPFIGMELTKIGKRLETCLYRKTTNKGLLLHYQSHVDACYKRSLLMTMLNRAHCLSSSPDIFAEECDNLRGIFLKLKYPEKLINSTITRFIESRNQQQVRDVQRNAPVQIILPFKDQRSADIVPRQLSDLGKKINSDIRPVFTSKKIADDIRVAEAKPPLINQQCVVYKFKCDLCDADYVGYTRRHLFQRIDEHKYSAIGKHLRDSHNQKNKDLTEQFTILKKCRGKFECLIYEMLFIQEMKPKLNTQSDSIKAKLFST
ncbi:uncharacterized protein [Porites lutea]|uniref:uncharacterized protein n=1 Tax=Porites lutea TaxID=51062 RepID=UPI003CC63F57